MQVISRKPLIEFWQENPDAESALRQWYKIADTASWTSLEDVRNDFANADGVTVKYPGGKNVTATVFNIGGNKYRLITKIDYQYFYVHVKAMMTHKEYDREK